MKKRLTALLATTIIASTSSMIYATEKIDIEKMDIDIYKEISESKIFRFGKLTGAHYSLNDKKVQDEIAKKIDSYKSFYESSYERIKTYDFYINIDKYEIGILKQPKNDGYYYFSISDISNDKYKFNTYKIKDNLYSELIKILNSTENVSININNRYAPYVQNSAPVDGAINVSQASFARSDNVVLVGKEGVSDALCSASLAGYLNAPILLSDKDTLNQKLVEELERLNVKNIYITSGNSVISKKVKDELISKGYKIKDYSGVDRYETSMKIAKEINKNNKYILASGENFNDIPSISPYAYENKIPILLTKKNNLPSYNYDLLNSGSNVLAVGGYKTIHNTVYKQIEKKQIKAQQIGGVDRFDTSKLIVEKLYPNAKTYIYETDEGVVLNIVTSSMSFKYKKPIRIVKNVVEISKINIDDISNIYFIK